MLMLGVKGVNSNPHVSKMGEAEQQIRNFKVKEYYLKKTKMLASKHAPSENRDRIMALLATAEDFVDINRQTIKEIQYNLEHWIENELKGLELVTKIVMSRTRKYEDVMLIELKITYLDSHPIFMFKQQQYYVTMSWRTNKMKDEGVY